MINSKRRISDCSIAHLIKYEDMHLVVLSYQSDTLSFKVKRSFSSRNAANDFYAKIDAQTEQQFLQLIFN